MQRLIGTVFFARAPRQIYEAIIVIYPVEVSDICASGARTNERLQHQRMHALARRPPTDRQNHANIAMRAAALVSVRD